MELLTDEIKQRFEEYPLYSQENKGINSTVIVKYFNPVGSGTWLITEAEKQLAGEGRVLVRESGTEPLLRIMLEGKDMELVKRLTDEIADVVKKELC